MTPPIEDCKARNHPIVECDWTEYCLVDHYRTDHSFAVWSQALLARIKAKAAA